MRIQELGLKIRWFGHCQAFHRPNKQLSRCRARRTSDHHRPQQTKLRARASLSARGLLDWRFPRYQDGHLHPPPNTKFVLNRGQHTHGMNQQKVKSQGAPHRMKKSMSVCIFEKMHHCQDDLNLRHPNKLLRRCQALHKCDDLPKRLPELVFRSRSHLCVPGKDGLSNSHLRFDRRCLPPSMIHRQY